MRIIGGAWRNRTIQAPEGLDTRPTTDRIREAIASIAISDQEGLDETAILDAFGGSGALSFELLSRGARHATIAEADMQAYRCIKANAQKLQVASSQVHVIRLNVFDAARTGRLPGGPFDLVLLDPPYATPVADVVALVEHLGQRGFLKTGALIVYERDRRGDAFDSDACMPVRTKHYGNTMLDLTHYDPDAAYAARQVREAADESDEPTGEDHAAPNMDD